MRLALGVGAILIAGASIVWTGVQMQAQLAGGEDLNPLLLVVAGVALSILVLVALLSDSWLPRARLRHSGSGTAGTRRGNAETESRQP